jgi:cobalt/nickel transport protein
MLKKTIITSCVVGLLMAGASQVMAHFGMVIPSENIVTQKKKTVGLILSFSHPFENSGMELVKPQQFYVSKDGKQTDLLNSLKKTRVMEHTAWQTNYRVKRPGVYHFAMIPQPYWEPAEDVSIIHYTKTIIAAFGADDGWDEPMGLPTEIIPMLRPFGNYAGNSFSGQVLMNGQPVPNAEVEVEFYNQDGFLAAPSDYHVTQVIKTDQNGVFSFVCPRAGWWGFAALNEADYTLKNPKGEAKGVELGAVLWVYLNDYQAK